MSISVTEAEIGAVIAALSRASALAATAPVIGDAPARARLVFVIAVAIGVGVNRDGIPLGELPPIVLLELATGLLTGTCARFIMARVAVAGQLVGLSLGLGFASQYDPQAGESAGTLRVMFSTLAGLAFLFAGGLEALVRSCAASPAHLIDVAQLAPAMLRAGSSAMTHGLALAAPIVLAALVGNIGLAVMNRAAPAVNVFAIALSAVLVLGGVVLLGTTTDLIGGITEVAKTAIGALTP
jgi:flagellar biosynthesis protein FliR